MSRALGLSAVWGAAFLSAAALPATGQPASCPSAGDETVTVADVIDGDTVRLDNGTVVRLAAVEAPKRPLGVSDDRPWPLA